MGPHNSGVVLVPYSDRIAAFKEKYGARAPIMMFKEEYEEEVAQLYCLSIIDFRELNRRIKKDKFPLPKIQNILDAIGCSERLSSFDVEDAFFNVTHGVFNT